jgi:glycosyltransferase involved in cell wall biosynthesis
MRVTIIHPVLNSHEIVRRQLLHYDKIGIPEDTEVIIVDDGSDPPIEAEPRPWLRIIQTNDKRPWTSSLARNTTAPQAKGEYIIFADLDHIITKEIIELVRNFNGDFMRFNRAFAILDEEGNISQDLEVLREYGLSDHRIKKYGTFLNPHRNQYATRKDFFINVMKGYNERLILTKPYPQREDGNFSRRWDELHKAGKVRDFDDIVGYKHRANILLFPSGKYCEGGDVDADPKGLFHTLTRKTSRNPYYKK